MRQGSGAEVVLVCMPYAELQRPSPALGILHGVLREAGIDCESVYANLTFAEELPFALYRLVMMATTQDGFADWTFAHEAFPDFESDTEAYLAMVHKRLPMPMGTPSQLAHNAAQLRRAATDFTDRLARDIVAREPRIVGCSSTLVQHVPSLALLRRVRELAPEIVTVLGGANCETVMGRSNHRHFPWVDYVVSGEADRVIVPLIEQIREHGQDIPAGVAADGVFVPQHRWTGYPRRAVAPGADDAPRAMIGSMADLPTPFFDDYFSTLEKLPRLGTAIDPGLVLETSRGCWFGEGDTCTFCGLNAEGTAYRSRPAAEVLNDLETLSERHGVYKYEFVDNILDMRYFKDLVPQLGGLDAPYRIFYETKSNLKREHVRALREAGVVWIQPGLESLHSGFLRLMKKGCESWTNVQLLKWTQEFGVRVIWYILREFPGEDEEWYGEMAERVPYLAHLQPPGSQLDIMITRYSQYHERPEEFGLTLYASRPYEYVYPLDAEQLADQIYFFDYDSNASDSSSSVVAALLGHPGRRLLTRSFKEWNLLWTDDPPILEMAIEDDRIEITDTRPIAVERRLTLTGLEREVYLACEEGRTPRWLHESFARRGVEAGAVDRAVAALQEKRILLELDGRLLSLAVRASQWDFVDRRGFPGGTLDLESARGEPLSA
jgi:ribosomal peptide maturation radical SAM protein 1